MLSRFHLIPVRYGQTDRRTDGQTDRQNCYINIARQWDSKRRKLRIKPWIRLRNVRGGLLITDCLRFPFIQECLVSGCSFCNHLVGCSEESGVTALRWSLCLYASLDLSEVRSVRPSIRSFIIPLTILWTRCFENESLTDFAANCRKCYTGQGDETINF